LYNKGHQRKIFFEDKSFKSAFVFQSFLPRTAAMAKWVNRMVTRRRADRSGNHHGFSRSSFLLHHLALCLSAFLLPSSLHAQATPNYVETTNFNVDGNNNNVVTINYSDGLGRPLQTQTLDNSTNNVLVSGEQYDTAGRPWKAVKPFAYSNSGTLNYIYDDLITGTNGANAYFNGSNGHPDAGGYAYSETQYHPDPLNRVGMTGAPGLNYSTNAIAGGHPAMTWYFGSPGPQTVSTSSFFTTDGFLTSSVLDESDLTGSVPTELAALSTTTTLLSYSLTVTMDANGHFSQILQDLFGNTVSTWSKSGSDPSVSTDEIVSNNTYDLSGNIITATPPQQSGQANVSSSQYVYNTLNQLIQKTTPDGGTVYYGYNDAGQLSWFFDGNHGYAYLQYSYDDLGRNTAIQGLGYGDSEIPYWSSTKIRNIYDSPDDAEAFLANSAFETSTEATILSGLTNTNGRIVASIAYDANFTSAYDLGEDPEEAVETNEINYSGKTIDLFSYDDDGRVIQKYKSIPGLPLQLRKYGYDIQGKLLHDTLEYTSGTPATTTDILTDYAYDPNGRLFTITRNGQEFVRYTYNDQGQIVQKSYAYSTAPGAQTHNTQYTYTINDGTQQIKSNNGEFEEDLCYDNNNVGDGNSSFQPQYNGNISRATTALGLSSIPQSNVDLLYAYDGLNRLTGVTNNETYGTATNYNGLYSYFSDGRILQKQENGQSGWGSYTYYADPNAPGYVTNQIMDIPGSNKGDPSNPGNTNYVNYIYDNNGNMVFDKSKMMAIVYDWRNMPDSFYFFSTLGSASLSSWADVLSLCTSNASNISSILVMTYDASGNRVKKEVFEPAAAGTVGGSSTPPAAGDPALMITNSAQTATLAIKTDGTLYTNEPITGINQSIPSGALVWQDENGVQLAFSTSGLQVYAITGNSTTAPAAGDLSVAYSSDETPPAQPQAIVLAGGSGIALSGAMPRFGTAGSGVAYIDGAAVFCLTSAGAGYGFAYAATAEGVSDPDNTFEFYLKDHLGSTRAVMIEGASSWSFKQGMNYLAYGTEIDLLTVAGTQTGSEEVRERFTGKELDVEGSSLSYFGKRYYDAEIGEWTSMDPDYQFWSPYSYAGNGTNPISGIDDYGFTLLLCSAPAFDGLIPGTNHAFIWSTKLNEGRGMNGSVFSSIQFGGNASGAVNPAEYPEILTTPIDLQGQDEGKIMSDIKNWPGWNKTTWTPFGNNPGDCHGEVAQVLKYVGLQNPGVPNGRVNWNEDYNTMIEGIKTWEQNISGSTVNPAIQDIYFPGGVWNATNFTNAFVNFGLNTINLTIGAIEAIAKKVVPAAVEGTVTPGDFTLFEYDLLD
jgi:RHS repeat-associated protein